MSLGAKDLAVNVKDSQRPFTDKRKETANEHTQRYSTSREHRKKFKQDLNLLPINWGKERCLRGHREADILKHGW